MARGAGQSVSGNDEALSGVIADCGFRIADWQREPEIPVELGVLSEIGNRQSPIGNGPTAHQCRRSP